MTRSELIDALNRFSVTGDPETKVNNGTTWVAIQKVELDPDSNTLLVDTQPPL